ncbi:MAG: thioesterase domain-containing protein [Microthrixaceae bacterium]
MSVGRADDGEVVEARADALPPRAPLTTKAFGYNLNGLELRMASLWAVVFDRDRDSFKVDDDLFELGADDRQVELLLDLVEDEWGIRPSSSQVRETPTLRALGLAIKAEARLSFGHAAPPEWIAPGQPDRSPVVCVAAMGATNLTWRRLAARLDPRIPMIGVESVGFDGRGRPLPRVETIARYHVERLHELVGDRPIVLCGHSFGGTVAFEIARQLAARGQKIVGLVLLDTAASRRLGREPWTVRRSPVKIRNFFSRHRHGHHVRLGWAARYLGLLGTEGEGRVRWVLHAQSVAFRSYRPKPFPGDLTLLTVDSIGRDRDETLGWGKLVRGDIRLHLMPGLHEDLLRTATVDETAKVLDECFLRLTAPAGGDAHTD